MMLTRVFSDFFIKTSFYQKVFVALALSCSFLINLEASITKAVSNSLFIHAYGYEFLPYAWLALVPLNFLVVNFYNKFIPRIGLFYMFSCTTFITVVFSIVAAFFVFDVQGLPFCFYLWKDIYILLMFQQLWAMLAATISSDQAKFLYGLFWGVGGIGAVVGSFFPGFMATLIGTEKLLLVTLPFYGLLLLSYLGALKVRNIHLAKEPIEFDQKKPSSFLEGAKLIGKSKILLFILLIVIFMQVASTLLDFQFNRTLAEHISQKDLRTEYLGRFFGIVNGTNVFLQFFGSYFVLNFMGVKRTHFFIPLYLGFLLTGQLFFPTFLLLSLSYGSIKALDYSIFGIVREMLYIPLRVEEKFQGRAVIDVFVYRTAKALASCCIISFGFFTTYKLSPLITKLLIFIFFIWALTVIFLLKNQEEKKEQFAMSQEK
jgi:AAA family ATP:ADP antiporter